MYLAPNDLESESPPERNLARLDGPGVCVAGTRGVRIVGMRVSLVLAPLVATLALVGAGCGGDEDASDDATPTVTESTETGVEETTETDGEETATTDDDAAEGDAANGEQVFASAGCGGCHTLAAAGANGSVGPNLDDASPSSDKVVERVTNGEGVMPSFANELSAQQIQDVAAFVSSSVDG